MAIDADKKAFLNELLKIYQEEIDVIYAIDASWELLKDAAKEKCVDDFDKAIIARETLLEELGILKDEGHKTDKYDGLLFAVDQTLLKYSNIVKDLYRFDVKSFLNVKSTKKLPKPK